MTIILLCRARLVPTPEQVADALCSAGYNAYVEVETGNLIHSLTAEIRYASRKFPIVVEFYHDLIDNPDVGDYDFWDWMNQLVPDAEKREGIRRFIFIDALENVDADALQTAINFLCDQTHATAYLQERPSKQ